MVLGKIHINLKEKYQLATRQFVFLSQVSEMQVHIWSTGQVLSDKFLMAKFIFCLFFDNILLIFVFPTVVGFL